MILNFSRPKNRINFFLFKRNLALFFKNGTNRRILVSNRKMFLF